MNRLLGSKVISSATFIGLHRWRLSTADDAAPSSLLGPRAPSWSEVVMTTISVLGTIGTPFWSAPEFEVDLREARLLPSLECP